ncbi:MAG TPA: hypothetical protein VMB05_12510 [Solirubrobacteraceae bacterium]|nr:hypothetical protein [Solirubrobacteraceae bacterium]
MVLLILLLAWFSGLSLFVALRMRATRHAGKQLAAQRVASAVRTRPSRPYRAQLRTVGVGEARRRPTRCVRAPAP